MNRHASDTCCRIRSYRPALLFVAVLGGVVAGSCAADDAKPVDWYHDAWPLTVSAGGWSARLSGRQEYDFDRFQGTDNDPDNARRQVLGLWVTNGSSLDFTVNYEFKAKTFYDVLVRIHPSAWTDTNTGVFRIGYMKTFVGFEGTTNAAWTTFMERSMAIVALDPLRRIGADWLWLHPHWLLNAGLYRGGDLSGGNDGHMEALHAAVMPVNRPGEVVHLGASISVEHQDWTRDGRGVDHPPAASFSSRPEAYLTDPVVSTGALAVANSITRQGLEFLTIHGPWSFQAEHISARVDREGGLPRYMAHGYYAFVSWMATGESRGYADGNVAPPEPRSPMGAVEFALRYSALDLDDASVEGGRAHNVTAGVNWYASRHLKVMANYVWAHSDRQLEPLTQRILEARVQLMF